MRLHIHQTGTDWVPASETTVTRIKRVSDEYKKDGSPDGVVVSFPWRGLGQTGPTDDNGAKLKMIFYPETVEEVDGFIRQLGELKSRMLLKKVKSTTKFGE